MTDGITGLVPASDLSIEYHPEALEKVLILVRHLMMTYKGLLYSEYKADELYSVSELEKIVGLRGF